MCSSNVNLLSILTHDFSHLLLLMSAAPIFTCSVLSMQSNTWHLFSLPFIWLSINQLNSEFADLSSEPTTILILSPIA